ncbi:MAG: hypothetical protein COC06_08710 [Bacteroidales bacterium]|nr:MAG: hypothetical protein COC06_08710 [Bacteroidales bacterium]
MKILIQKEQFKLLLNIDLKPLNLLQWLFYANSVSITQNIKQNYLFCTVKILILDYFSQNLKPKEKSVNFY